MKDDSLSLLIEARSAAATGRGRRLREAAGPSLVEMARLVGVTQPAVARWESGERRPNPNQAIAYAKALRRLEELLERVSA
jgi:transcriptional regulator with XRE-family HTH domain